MPLKPNESFNSSVLFALEMYTNSKVKRKAGSLAGPEYLQKMGDGVCWVSVLKSFWMGQRYTCARMISSSYF